MLISLELENISRNVSGVLTGSYCTFIEENKDFHFIYTLKLSSETLKLRNETLD